VIPVADSAKAGAAVFVAAIVQVTICSRIEILGGTPNLLLVTLLSIALLRGTIFGAACGFWGGLVVDTANLATLGVSSLLLTVSGYWIGRYGETTGRDRTHAPFLSVGVVTILYALGAMVVHFMLGDPVSARLVLLDALPPSLLLNLILTAPVHALVRRLLPQAAPLERAREVSLLG
jgi:rod shape-determining protein MreD